MCGTVWCGIGGDSLCCVWERLLWICEIEIVLCVGEFGVGLGELGCAVCGSVWCGFGGVCLCCVCESLGVVCLGREFVLCVGKFGVGLGE